MTRRKLPNFEGESIKIFGKQSEPTLHDCNMSDVSGVSWIGFHKSNYDTYQLLNSYFIDRKYI